VVDDRLHNGRIGLERTVHVGHVAGAEAAAQNTWITMEAVATTEPQVVVDVAGALLDVRQQASPFEDLGEDVGRLFARQVDAAELRDGIVAVLHEVLLVERLGSTDPDGCVHTVVARHVKVADELVEKQPPQALRAS
jgi:hypothetical protein